MATIAIGDVHGNRAALDDLLARLRRELHAGDTVVFLGDYIDRGPDSKGCIDSILGFTADVAVPVVTLCGNHEDWLLRTMNDPHRHSWLMGMEAFPTIASYSPAAAETLRRAVEAAGSRLIFDKVALPYECFFEAMPREHVGFFRNLPAFHRSDDAVCVHAGLDPGAGPVEAQQREDLIWGTRSFLEEYVGPDIVLYGHWNNAQVDADLWPQPSFGPASIGLDTSWHGVVTAVRLPDRRVFQSARFS